MITTSSKVRGHLFLPVFVYDAVTFTEAHGFCSTLNLNGATMLDLLTLTWSRLGSSNLRPLSSDRGHAQGEGFQEGDWRVHGGETSPTQPQDPPSHQHAATPIIQPQTNQLPAAGQSGPRHEGNTHTHTHLSAPTSSALSLSLIFIQKKLSLRLETLFKGDALDRSTHKHNL